MMRTVGKLYPQAAIAQISTVRATISPQFLNYPYPPAIHSGMTQRQFKVKSTSMQKRNNFDNTQLMYRAEDLISAASNRYRITVQVANRAKRRRYEDFENGDDPIMKPVLRAIIEMSDELTQPEIIGE